MIKTQALTGAHLGLERGTDQPERRERKNEVKSLSAGESVNN